MRYSSVLNSMAVVGLRGPRKSSWVKMRMGGIVSFMASEFCSGELGNSIQRQFKEMETSEPPVIHRSARSTAASSTIPVTRCPVTRCQKLTRKKILNANTQRVLTRQERHTLTKRWTVHGSKWVRRSDDVSERPV